MVCKDAVIHFANIHAQQAHEYLAQWFEFWKHAQQYPVLLPAALVLKMKDKKEFEIQWDEAQSDQVLNMESFVKHWHDGARRSFIDESEKNHPDWSFIFQDSETEPLLIEAFQQYSHRLYQPIIENYESAKNLQKQGESV